MSIDINGINSSQAAARVSNTSADDAKLAQEKTADRSSGQSSTSDTVSLSDSARQLGKLENTVSASPVIDTQRVEAVKQAIQNGEYEVDPVKVASKLMQFESMLKPEG